MARANRELNQWSDWIMRAKVGESVVYHRGHLANDRTMLHTHDGYMANEVAKLMWSCAATPRATNYEMKKVWAQGLGMVSLTQRKIGDAYEYIATKMAEPRDEVSRYAKAIVTRS